MRFPHNYQLDDNDCGPASLSIIAKFYGKHYSLEHLREKCHITRDGVSMLGISHAAELIGFRTVGVKITWKQLREEANLPCIIHWNQQHFAVVYRIKKRRGKYWVYVSDPAIGLLKYNEVQFRKSWEESHTNDLIRLTDYQGDSNVLTAMGVALLLEPTPKFYKEKGDEDNRLRLRSILQYLSPYKSYLIQLILAMLTSSMLSFLLPFMAQSVVDTGINNGDKSYVLMILLAQLSLILGQSANSLIRSWLMLHMTTRISISLISDFLSKLMRLPIAFFDSKKVGDIMQRIGDYDRIQNFLTGSLLSMLMAIVSFIIYGLIMGIYDLQILVIFLVGSALYIGWILCFLKYRRKVDYMRFQEASANQSNVVQLINGMQDIKLNNCEKQKRWEWEHIQARLFKVSIKGLSLEQTQEIGAIFVDQTKNMLISFLAASYVIDGRITFGVMVALQYLIGQLNAPLSQFIKFIQATQDARLSLERLSEIEMKEDEEPSDKKYIQAIPENVEIEFKNVTFQYDGPHSIKALDNVSTVIPANKITAIVGTSGSGKTTMLKMILGYYTPISGQIFLNGKRIEDYSISHWRSNCGVVMQEGYIFADTIANNIGVSDEQVDIEKLKKAARIANIGKEIESLPLGYETRIGADGHGISTGQKQRMLIARAAYKNCKCLFFDEATNSLDANNETAIMTKLHSIFKNKTVVIIAHRLSTVKNADKIIVLDHGQIIEEGTHCELIHKAGTYYKLVKNQLELGM